MRFSILFVELLFSPLLLAGPWQIEHHRFTYSWDKGTRCLRVEVLDDDLIHFEIYERREVDHQNGCLREGDAIWISPMVAGGNGPGMYFDRGRSSDYKTQYQENYQGPNPDSYRKHGDGVETSELRVSISDESRCIHVFDKARNAMLTDICAEDLDKDSKRLNISKRQMFNFYGLGNLFTRGLGLPNGDWKGIVWDAPKKSGRPGNMRGPTFYNGDPSTSQFPMIYALGNGSLNYGLFLDQPYRMTVDVTQNDHLVYETWGDEIRFFVLSGPNLKDLRSDFMQLTGRPPVPPKRQFGHWTSKFGFKSWDELEKEVNGLRAAGFPLDGAALDLQWFGARFGRSDVVKMGLLQFAEPEFGGSDWKVVDLYHKKGIHLMPIEESYIDTRLPEFRALCDSEFRKRTAPFSGITSDTGCFLARTNLDFDLAKNGWAPSLIDVNFKQTLNPADTVWWGKGGMLDHSNPHARHYWHQLKRLPLSAKGVLDHWFDLGEPEMFFEYAWYAGFPELFREYRSFSGENIKHAVQMHGDVHNLYNLFWARGAEEGYSNASNAGALKDVLKRLYGHSYNYPARHWTMSRAGTVGSQRYGGMWTGDTRGNFENLTGHLQTQLHMSLLGIDYYSADAGGFFHAGDGTDPREPYDVALYSQWYANASLLDVPLRPHGWAEGADTTYAANARGHVESNRRNVYRRYELVPYLYSLAYRAHLFAEPIFPPLVYYFQEDLGARENGTEKMIGPSLLFRVLVQGPGFKGGEEHGNPSVYLPKGTWVDYESFEWFDSEGKVVSLPNSAWVQNPLYARAGAIIPKAYVDEKTMNTEGKRWGEEAREDLVVRVFASGAPSEFTLYEDDGVSKGYLHGEVRRTILRQIERGNKAEVVIEKSDGSYVGAPETRPYGIELIVRGRKVASAALNGHSIAFTQSGNLVRANLGKQSVGARKAVEFIFE